jgi:hypothetical protein
MAAERNVIQQTLDAFGKGAEMVKQSGTWYRVTDEVIEAVNLQKSQYGPRYYVNVGWWLRSLGDVKFPKDHQWHIGIRLESLAVNCAEDVKALLDLDSGIAESERSQRLRDLLEAELRPVLDRTRSVDGLRELRREGRLKAAAVRGPAIPILDQAATPGS